MFYLFKYKGDQWILIREALNKAFGIQVWPIPLWKTNLFFTNKPKNPPRNKKMVLPHIQYSD